MDKKEEKKVIPFPQLDQRLLNKGRDLLEQGKVEEALELLLEAEKLNDENPEILYTLTAAYIKQGDFRRARAIVERLLNEGIGDYFMSVEMYIPILFQLHEYKRINQLITMLLEEGVLPEEKQIQYEDLQALCERLEEEARSRRRKPAKLFKLLKGNSEQVARQIIALDDDDLEFYLEEIKEYLLDGNTDPFIKTMLLSKLHEAKIEEQIRIRKFKMDIEIIPSQYPAVGDVNFSKNVRHRIVQKLEDDNPVLKDFAVTLCDRFFFHIYPLEKDFHGTENWAEALIFVAKEYLGVGEDIHQEEESNLSQDFVDVVNFILYVEQYINL